MNPAVSLALFAYAWWGLVPVYWKHLLAFPSEELILYRILFSLVFLLLLVAARGRWQAFRGAYRDKKILRLLLASGATIGFNWYLYVWAVNHGHVVDASLGYFINPLVNIALGRIFLGERLRRFQKAAGLLAFLGTGLLVYYTQALPWIALLLAFSFAFYGLLRKLAKVETIPGTLWETLLLAAPAILFLALLFAGGQAHAPQATGRELAILSLCGIITTVPLLAFAEAARSLSLSMMGFLQFLSPTLQFLLGVFVYHESFDTPRFLAFLLIWAGLLLFLFDLYKNSRKKA